MNRPIHHGSHDGGQRTRIDTPGQKQSHRDITDEMTADGLLQSLADLLNIVRNFQRTVFTGQWRLPVAALPHPLSCGPAEHSSRHQLADPLIEGLVAGDISAGQKLGEYAAVEARPPRHARENGFDLRSEQELGVAHRIVQRLDSKAVTRHEQPLSRNIPEGKCKHSLEVIDAIIAVYLVRFDHDLSVRLGLEPATECFQLSTQLAVVIDLTVVCQPDALAIIAHRLSTGGEINDGQSAVRQSRPAVDDHTGPIRTPVYQ